MASQRARVALIVGGSSSEHGVSCLTAANVLRAIDAERFEVIGVGITKSGRWVQLATDDIAALKVQDGQLPELSEEYPNAVWLSGGEHVQIADRNGDGLVNVRDVDVAFALLHGPFGEDGTIQGMFEMLGLRYVGAGVATSALGMDKQMTKQILASAGLPIGPFVAISPAEWARDPSSSLDAVASLGFPVFVKPARGGSSIGISRVDSMEGMQAAIELAQLHDPKVIVEQGLVDSREIECGVLGGLDDEGPQASKVAEIVMHTENKFYDFESKYLPGEQVSLVVPAELDADLVEQVREVAVAAFTATGCEGMARVDTFITREGRVVINEINTMPGFTEHSMFPLVWDASGVRYPELISRLVELALQRPLGLR